MDICVVEFDAGDLLLVHSKWLTEDGECYCPPYWGNSSKLKKAIVTGETPNFETWKLYRARVLKRESSYDRAWKVMKQAETANTTDLGIDTPTGRGCRRRTRRRLSQSSASSEDTFEKVRGKGINNGTACVPNSQPLRPPLIHLNTEESNPMAAGDNVFLQSEVDALLPTQRDPQPPLGFPVMAETAPSPITLELPCFSPMSVDSGTRLHNHLTNTDGLLLRQVLRELSAIHIKLDAQKMLLDSLVIHKQVSEQTGDPSDDPNLPKSSLEDLLTLERDLVDSENKIKLVSKLAAVGGANDRDTTYRVMAKLMTNEVALLYSWAGLKGKLPFKELNLKDCVLDAVKKNPLAKGPTELQIDDAIKYWLKRAQERINASLATAQKNPPAGSKATK